VAKNAHCLDRQALTKMVEAEWGVPATLVYYLASPPDVILICDEEQRLKALKEMTKKIEYLQPLCIPTFWSLLR
jgi:hypothetical protein